MRAKNIVLILTVFATYIVIGEVYDRYCYVPELKKDFADFYSSRIQGRVTRISKGKVDVRFSVDNKPKQSFHVLPINSGGLGSFRTTFSWLVAVGDSVAKNTMSDSMTLHKKNEVFKFAFSKPE